MIGVIENPAFVNEGNGKSEASKDNVFQNPTCTDAPVITRLDGNTKPITRSAITRITSGESKPSVSTETGLSS